MRGCAAPVAAVRRGAEPSTPNAELDAHWNRVHTAEALSRANELGRRGRLEEARVELRRATVAVQCSPSLQSGDGSDAALSKNCVRDLEACLSSMDTAQAYRARGSKIMAASAQMHSMQRCNASSMDDTGSAAMYENVGKRSAKARWSARSRDTRSMPAAVARDREVAQFSARGRRRNVGSARVGKAAAAQAFGGAQPIPAGATADMGSMRQRKRRTKSSSRWSMCSSKQPPTPVHRRKEAPVAARGGTPPPPDAATEPSAATDASRADGEWELLASPSPSSALGARASPFSAVVE